MKDLTNEIRAYSLKNALEFGKADVGKILPKLFQHGLDKKDISKIMPFVIKIVGEINKLGIEEKKKAFEQVKSYVKEKEEEVIGQLPELENVSDKMVFRLAPYPSGALHIGNAKTYLLNALYAEKYKAKTLLVMDDTIGSEEKQIAPEAYELLQEAFNWLGVRYQIPVIYKSDRIDLYYKYAEDLIKMEKAYVDFSPQKKMRDMRAKGQESKWRNLPVEEQLKNWEKMFEADEGKCVLRIKTDMKHPNPAFRDRVLFKISDRRHPRVGNRYRVWPTLEMSWAIDDHLLGITHILRGNDLMIETDMEKYIWDLFDWEHPVTMHAGLINIEGMGAKISKSKAQKEVKSGEFSGWDDPRTWSMQSLRRRGIKPEAIREFVKEIGLNKQDITVPIETLYSINRKLIDANALRFSAAFDKVELKIKNAPKIEEVEVQIHPDKQEKRKIKIGKIFINGEDYKELKGKEIRLLHLYNVKISKGGVKGNSEFTSEENKNIRKINWVSQGLPIKVLMPNGEWKEGIAEEAISQLKVGEMIQFERFGFCRFDKKSDKYEFWFSHR